MDYNDERTKKAAEIFQSFWAINKITSKLTQQNAESLGLTLQQLAVLNTLFSFPGLTLKQLTERLMSPKSTVSVSVDGLVNLRLVERNISEADRREIKLNLTNEGKELSKKSSENAPSYKAMIFALDKMSKEDIQSLLRIHKELSQHLEHFHE
ncbi:helix-turn-helix domain-containing protein [Paenibacillus sediminis]|uniref:DNA-binding MarR family transcriptional regulator n=1 Tax=Paenibacillus sediminis TaxID=664909 RepID=A0ABS4GZX4_9BACL|nr:helix-turn-helix domain-containing protein [Paenibacillus sediminis]MBP1935828.1 DNA-binding MarR family transcriptional regulator [Paenibacillus sediminis]